MVILATTTHQTDKEEVNTTLDRPLENQAI